MLELFAFNKEQNRCWEKCYVQHVGMHCVIFGKKCNGNRNAVKENVHPKNRPKVALSSIPLEVNEFLNRLSKVETLQIVSTLNNPVGIELVVKLYFSHIS